MNQLAIIALLLVSSASVASGQQATEPVIAEQAIGDNWKEWREERRKAMEERQLAREERAKVALRFDELTGMLKRLFWCVYGLAVLILIAVILYLAKPVFQLIQGVTARWS